MNNSVVGSVIQIHGDISIECELVPSSEDIKEVETQICDLLNNSKRSDKDTKILFGQEIE